MKNVTVLDNRSFWFALLFALAALTMAVIAGGVDSVVPAAHDTFHEIRHAIGIPCH